jgi:ABC-type uncharacterized transport system involved in gliding motility auxiliary subunit
VVWVIVAGVLLGFWCVAVFVTGQLFHPLAVVHFGLAAALLVVAALTSAGEIRSRLAQSSNRRGLLFGSNAAVQITALVVILGLVAYLAQRHPKQWDWTEAGVHSLAQATTDTLARIPQDELISVYAFFIDPGPARRILERYQGASDRFSYRLIKPNEELQKSQLFEIDADQIMVVCRGPCETASGEKATVTVKVTEPSEEKITRAIRTAISDKKKIYFLAGHEEGDPNDESASGMALARKALEADNLAVGTHALASDPQLPADADALVLASPTRPLLPIETEAIDRYLKGGGSLLVLIDPLLESRLEPTLASWGVKVSQDVIVDSRPQLFSDPALVLEPVARSYGDHPITRALAGNNTIYKLARSVEAEEAAKSDVVTLVETGPASWAAGDVAGLKGGRQKRGDPDQDRRGPISIAVARSFKVEKPAAAEGKAAESSPPAGGRSEGRLVVVGDADFARNEGLMQVYNSDLLVNMANWLVGEEEFITIDRKLPRASSVQMSSEQVYAFTLVSIFLLPELLLLLGIVHWRRRRAS